MEKGYCIRCGKDREIIVREETVTEKIQGLELTFLEKCAFCSVCGEEIIRPDIHDGNIARIAEAYHKKMEETDK